MDTVNLRSFYIKTTLFIKEGGNIFNSKYYNNIISKYFIYLNNNDIKDSTIYNKIVFISSLLNYFEMKKISLKDIHKTDIYNYINSFDNSNYSFSIIDINKHEIKYFFNWAFNNNYSKLSGDMILPKINWHRKANIKTYYSMKEIIKLLNVIDRRTKKGKEDYLIICLICYLGLRISDVINLKINNIDFNENTISIIQYKTDKKLILPLIDEVKYAILDYLKNVRPIDTDLDYIFITNIKPYKHNIRLKSNSTMVKKYFIKAGVNINNRKAGFHSLRHSFSTMLLNENVPLYSISNILGHSSTNSTFTYLDIDTSKLKELALEVPLC